MCKNHGARLPDPPTNAFVPVTDCWACASVDAVAQAAWRRESGLTLRDWLPMTASGMRHRMHDHGLPPRAAAPGHTGEPPPPGVGAAAE
ncbi:hypothetical protein ACIOFV_52775 [Streptomyces mirabilis]|uniref:hypothetical protein n=1 Tax=Streptomyces mirabilis TaxID=68239 RepID=UPI003816B5EA